MKNLIKAFAALLIICSAVIAVREYEMWKVRQDIVKLITSNPEFSKLSIRRAKPLMLELQGSFETKESFNRFTTGVSQAKARRIFFRPLLIYPPDSQLIIPSNI